MDSKKINCLHKKTKPSSQKWLLRHMNDPYVQRARKENYRCRSAFKIEEVQSRFAVFKQGQRILDLGCAPGGWSQWVLRAFKGQVKVLGVDLLVTPPLEGADFLQGDLADPLIQQEIKGNLFDVILSDMAPSFTGHAPTDTLLMEDLLALVYGLSHDCLKIHGTLVVKAFHGNMAKILKPAFETVRHFKPKSSRPTSREIYIVAQGFKKC